MNKKLLKQKIRATGLKQKEVAAHLGISFSEVNQLINGRHEFGVLQIRALMKLLRLSRDEVDLIFFME